MEIEAILWTGHNVDEVMKFVFEDERWKEFARGDAHVHPGIGHTPALGILDIPTLEGIMTANANDFIIRGLKGELYPCKPDIFALKYELVL